MAFDPMTALFEAGKMAIERIWPDPNKRAEELRKLEELRQAGDLERFNGHVQLLLGQIEVNKVEAAHKSLFVAGWRPSVGWITSISLGLAYIPKVTALTVMWIWQCVIIFSSFDPAVSCTAEALRNGVACGPVLPEYPDLGISDLIGLLGSMLGVGIMRSVDKSNGVQTDRLGAA